MRSMAADIAVFRIVPLWNDFQALLVEAPFESYLHDLMKFDGTSRVDEWRRARPQFYVDRPERPVPDLWPVVSSASLGLSDRARDLVETHFPGTGELLPANLGDTSLHILNVTRVVACLDKERTRPDLGFPKAFAFRQAALPIGTIFKIPETSRVDILYCDATSDGEAPLAAMLTDNRLTGITLKRLWDASNGSYLDEAPW